MNKCLVTTLPVIADNDSLPYFNGSKLEVLMKQDNFSINSQNWDLFILNKGNVNAIIENPLEVNAYFTIAGSTVNLGSTVLITTERYTLHADEGKIVKLVLTNSQNIKHLTLSSNWMALHNLNLSSLRNMVNLETFGVDKISLSGDIENLRYFDKLGLDGQVGKWTQFLNGDEGAEVYGDISYLPSTVFALNKWKGLPLDWTAGRRIGIGNRMIGGSAILFSDNMAVNNFLIDNATCSFYSEGNYRNLGILCQETFVPSEYAKEAIRALYTAGFTSIKVNNIEMDSE